MVAVDKLALYFGYGSGGHFLRWPDDWGRSSLHPERDVPGFPWTIGHLDGGLLENGKVPDRPDGTVYWTCGGKPFWFAFYWWDRSGDKRGASNSGFYVRGFTHTEVEAAFAFACAAWPDVVTRQKYPLKLTDRTKQP